MSKPEPPTQEEEEEEEREAQEQRQELAQRLRELADGVEQGTAPSLVLYIHETNSEDRCRIQWYHDYDPKEAFHLYSGILDDCAQAVMVFGLTSQWTDLATGETTGCCYEENERTKVDA